MSGYTLNAFNNVNEQIVAMDTKRVVNAYLDFFGISLTYLSVKV